MGTDTNISIWTQKVDPSRVKSCLPAARKDGPAPASISAMGQRDLMNTGFWAFYRALEGAAAYESVGSQAFSIEQRIRMEAVGRLSSDRCRRLLKQHKLPLCTASEMLTNQKPLSRSGLVSLIIAYELPLVITLGNAEFRIIPDCESVGALVRQERGGYKYGDSDWLREWRPVHTFDVAGKPLLAVSSYKLDQLRKMASALSLPSDGLKKDIYARLCMAASPN